MIFSLEAIRTWRPELDWWRKVFLIAAIELLISGFYMLTWTATPEDLDKMAESCAASVPVNTGQHSPGGLPLGQEDAFYTCLNETSGLKRLFSP